MKHIKRADPVLASLDIAESLKYYTEKLGFVVTFESPDYGIVMRDGVEIHFWLADDKIYPESTSCYVRVEGIEALYEEVKAAVEIHPNGKLETKPWGQKEFAISDVHGNLLRFGEAG
ncbi:MAG: VOC family protein [Bacteroidota bacterium]